MSTSTSTPGWLIRLVEDARCIDLTVHERVIDLRKVLAVPRPRQSRAAMRVEIPAECIRLVTAWRS